MSGRGTSGRGAPAPRSWWVRAVVVLVGVLVAGVMGFLGLWQMQVFRDKEDSSAAHRAAEPAVSLLDRIPPGRDVGDVYGRTVTVSGRYLPDRAIRVVADDGTTRQLTALKLTDGRLLPVVVGSAEAMPSLPSGSTTVRGVFLPAEPGDQGVRSPSPGSPTSGATMGSVRLQALAQRWSEPLTPGFLTLDAEGSRSLGLVPAALTLPQGDGSAQNMGYALQWWAFAAAALGGAIVIARGMRPPADAAPVESDHDH